MDIEGQISAASEACERALPGRKIVCSRAAGWTSLLVQKFESPNHVEPFETLPSPEQLVVLTTKGECSIECFHNGAWRRAAYRPGCGSMTPGYGTSRLRWHSPTREAQETLHLYIPQHFLDSACDAYGRAGAAFKARRLDALAFQDPVVSQVAHSLVDAINTGASDLYAQSAAQFLTIHLLSLHDKGRRAMPTFTGPEKLSDRRLVRVIEYMNAHYSEPVTLDRLASEAHVSRFHFVSVFKKSVGTTPHRYLTEIRMDAAASMLRDTDTSIQEIAFACGYTSAAHFTAAFQKHFTQSPSLYRRTIQSPP